MARSLPDSVAATPRVALAHYPSPLEELPRLRAALGGGPRLFVKRDDALSFAFGGNKVRKIEYEVARALAEGCDTLVTGGSLQSNHARVTAAAAARLGLHAVLVLSGRPPARPTANLQLDRLVGAEIEFVARREDRPAAMTAAVDRLRRAGRRPFLIPIGGATPIGALGFVRAVAELADQGLVPDLIVHATSTGGTQAGLVAGCWALGLPTRVVGISADDPAADIERAVRGILAGLDAEWGLGGGRLAAEAHVEVDDGFVGDGYALPTAASEAAIALVARTEGLFLDPVYSAKAMAGLIAYTREGRFGAASTVLFWHTGGQVALFS